MLLIVALLLVPLLIVQAVTYSSWFDARQEAEVRDNLEVANALASTFQFYVADIRRDELALGTAIAKLQAESPQAVEQYLTEATKDYTTIRFWLWADDQGKVLASTSQTAKAVDLSGTSWFKSLAKGEESLLSDVILDEGAFHDCLIVARRIAPVAGKPAGFVVAAIETAKLSELAANIRRSEGATLGIFDRSGHVVHVNPENPPVGDNWAALDPLMRRAIDTGQVQWGEITWPIDGSSRIVVRLPTKTGFIIGASMNRELAYRPIMAMLRSTIVWNVAGVLVSLLAVFLLGRWMIAQVSALRQQAQEIGHGNLDYRSDVSGIVEFQELSQTFNEMARRRKEYESQREENLRHLQETHAELERITDELRASNKDLEQFAYVASHDLQEPLRMVAGYIQLLSRRYRGKIDKDADEFIAFAVDGVDRMQRLIQDLLAYSRVGTRGKPMAPVQMEKVFQQATRNLEHAIQESGAVVTHDALPTVTGDEVQLVQLIQNLVSNALKFRSDQPPRIHVWAEPIDGRLTFNVRDNGIGLDTQYGDRIFVIFQRLHTRDKYEGTGIGLAICKKVVERHGGRIWVDSVPGAGSTFHFTLGEQS